MDQSIISGGLLLLILAISAYYAVKGSDNQYDRMKGQVLPPNDEEPEIEVPDLGPAQPTTKVTITDVGATIKKNADELVTFFQNIPLAYVPNTTLGEMSAAIRNWCNTAGHKMNRQIAWNLAAKIQELYRANKVAPKEELDKAAEEAANKGKADVNAA